MTSSNQRSPNMLVRYLPHRGPSLYLFIALIVAAFSLGLLLSGGENDSAAAEYSDTLKADEPTTWTCSMHPQIRLPKSGQCPICFMDLIPLDNNTNEELGERQLKMSEAAVKLARISTTPVIRDIAEMEIRMDGKIGYDETRQAYITAWIDGRIDSLYADYTGIEVRPGDPLVQLYSPELLSAQEELIQAKQAAANLGGSSGGVLRSTAEVMLEASREKLRLLGLTDKQVKDIETFEKVSSRVIIYAPIGGIVVYKNAREGMYVKTGEPIYTIANLSKVWVLFDAYESDLAWLKKDQPVKFQSLAIPGEIFTGTVSFIDPILNEKSRTVKVRVIADNKNGRLKPGMFTNGTIKARLGDKKMSLLIPSTAPLITGTRAVVYVQTADNDGVIFEGREIRLGARAGDYYIVESGLVESELVVTNGAFKLDSELQIQAKPSMMSPAGGGVIVHQHDQVHQQTAEHSTMAMPETRQLFVSENILTALKPVYESYFKIQMALADDNLTKAKKGYAELKVNTQAVNMILFEDESHRVWMDLSDRIKQYSEAGEEATDIEQAREIFSNLSKSIIDLNDSFGHAGGQNFYLTFCPMAFNNKGAYWLQTVDTVYNSFYGASMLRCGSIKDTLEPK